MSPRVSVIIPSYNYGHYIVESLRSVQAQTLADWECVVVDDGSTDGSVGLVRSLAATDPRIRLIEQSNEGPSAARNLGVRHSRGAYLQFLDADDLLEPAKLATHAAWLDEHSEVGVVYGYSTFFRTEEPERVLYSVNGHLSRPLLVKVDSGRAALRFLQMFNIMPIPSALLRREVWDRAGGFNPSVRGSEDWDFWLRAAITGVEFGFVDAAGARGRIRIHAQSASRSTERMMRGLIDAARTFSASPAAAAWHSDGLPLVYEMSLGLDEAHQGMRLRAARRILRAAFRAPALLTRLRWAVYGLAAPLLPWPAYWWLVTREMPERGLELIRRINGESLRTEPESGR